MVLKLRQIVLLCVLGIAVIFAGIQSVQASPDRAMAAMGGSCCPDDCPPTPDCAPDCAAMLSCPAGGIVGLSGSQRVANATMPFDQMHFTVTDAVPPAEIAASGLQRPPKL